MEPGPKEQAWREAEAKAEAALAAKPPRVREIPAILSAPESEQSTDEPEAAENDAPPDTDRAPVPAEKSTPETQLDAKSEQVQALHKLAKELGLKVDARGVTVDERAGFRAEKRSWHAKQKAKEEEFGKHVKAAQAYYAPLHPAMEAIKSGDYDLAVRKLAEVVQDEEVAKEGLNGATKRYLKRAAGQDPRVDELEKKLRIREEEARKREEHEAQTREQQQQQAELQEFTARVGKQLAESAEDTAIKRLAHYPSFAASVVQRMQDRWDGVETLSPEEAADEVERETRAVYDELCKVYGNQDAAQDPESLDESSAAGRSGKATVGKKGKPHNGKHATEASPNGRALSAEEWRRKYARLMAQARD